METRFKPPKIIHQSVSSKSLNSSSTWNQYTNDEPDLLDTFEFDQMNYLKNVEFINSLFADDKPADNSTKTPKKKNDQEQVPLTIQLQIEKFRQQRKHYEEEEQKEMEDKLNYEFEIQERLHSAAQRGRANPVLLEKNRQHLEVKKTFPIEGQQKQKQEMDKEAEKLRKEREDRNKQFRGLILQQPNYTEYREEEERRREERIGRRKIETLLRSSAPIFGGDKVDGSRRIDELRRSLSRERGREGRGEGDIYEGLDSYSCSAAGRRDGDRGGGRMRSKSMDGSRFSSSSSTASTPAPPPEYPLPISFLKVGQTILPKGMYIRHKEIDEKRERRMQEKEARERAEREKKERKELEHFKRITSHIPSSARKSTKSLEVRNALVRQRQEEHSRKVLEEERRLSRGSDPYMKELVSRMVRNRERERRAQGNFVELHGDSEEVVRQRQRDQRRQFMEKLKENKKQLEEKMLSRPSLMERQEMKVAARDAHYNALQRVAQAAHEIEKEKKSERKSEMKSEAKDDYDDDFDFGDEIFNRKEKTMLGKELND